MNYKWICSNTKDMDSSIYFRKNFEVCGNVHTSELVICALGIGVCTINGVRISDDELSTPYTRYDKRIIYQKYDITKLIKPGKNTIGVHVGNGFYNSNMKTWNDVMASWRDKVKLSAYIDIMLASGKKYHIETDTTWKCCIGNRIYNQMRQGEICDMCKTQYGFDKPDFDDSLWENAVSAREPGGMGELMDMPPIRVIRKLNAVKSEKGFYDFGENISGRVRIKAKGKCGEKIQIIYDEATNEDGEPLGHIKYTAISENARLSGEDILILSGEYDEFAPCFCYHGFRYVWIKNEPEYFEICAEVMHTDLKTIGTFNCNDDMLNRIHKACVNSTLTNYMGIPTDCPHREQNGWTCDAMLSSDQALMNFDIIKSYEKWMNDFSDSQRPSGQLPGVVPSADWGYNWGSGPAWDSAIIIIPWKIYISTGETQVLKKMWQNMSLYMGYMERMSENYIVNFGLGDWCPPKNTNMCPPEITDTAYFYSDCILMGKIADLIGLSGKDWYEKGKKVKNKWRQQFMSDVRITNSQTFYACALYHGLIEESEISTFANKLNELVVKSNYHIQCGILGTKYIFTVLSENGFIDTLYKAVINPKCPSYAYWINNGMTTLCERWEISPSSRNHHMFSEVDNWFYRYIGGIKFTENGLIIKPISVCGINEFYVKHKGICVLKKSSSITVVLDRKAFIEINEQKICAEPGEYVFNI